MHAKEGFFEAAFRVSPHPIGITELETGCCLEVNDACLRIFGFQRDEVIGKTTLLLGIWPDPQERARLIARLQSEELIRNFEVSMQMKNGELRQFLISTDVIMLKRKRCLLTIGNDITDRKRAEEALRQLNATLEQRVAERTTALRTVQARIQILLKATPMVLYARRATGDYGTTFVSENVMGQLGYSLQDFTDHAGFWVSRVHPDDRQDVLGGLAKLSEHDQQVREYRFLHKDGTYRWLHDVVRLLRSEDGVPGELVGFQIDVTQRKNAEEALRRSEAFTASVVDNLPNMLFVKDARDLRFVRLNKAGEQLLGYSERELIGKNDYDFFPAHEADFFTAKDREVLASKRLVDIHEEPIRTRHGDRLLHTKKIPLADRDGRPQYLLGISEDITDRKLAETVLQAKQVELERSQAQLRDLTSKLITAQETERRRIARDLHDDFTQRLAALTIDLRYLSAPVPELDEPRSHRLDQLAEMAEQLTTDLQRLAHQLHPSILEHVGLEAAVREHAEEFAVRTGLTTEVVIRNVPAVIPLEQATCLYRVLQESLQNVRKHAEATGVLVRLLKTGRGIGLCVHDDGHGFTHMPEVAPSRGLGLTSMAERVKGLQGTFCVKTRPGDGTEIHAWVPCTRDEIEEDGDEGNAANH